MTSSPLPFRITIAQLNPVVGDIKGNLEKARRARIIAANQRADLVLYSELFLSGYPPQDLVMRPAFLELCEKAAHELVCDTLDGGPGFVMGVPLKREGRIYNSVIVADLGKIIAECFKTDLPEYDEFDEKRLFSPAPEIANCFDFRNIRLGVAICEDIWGDSKVCEALLKDGAEIILVPNGSPFYQEKIFLRQQAAKKQALKTGIPLIYSNQVGGQDELVFDGGSFVLSRAGEIVLQMPQFSESVVVSHWTSENTGWECERVPAKVASISSTEEADYRACLMGLYDYVTKNHFTSILLGLSGGVDSALCATLAVDAFGSQNVHAVMMPYRYTSETSLRDARNCAMRLGCRYDEIPIFDAVKSFEHALRPVLGDISLSGNTLTYENLQSRTRGAILMSISNHCGHMLLSTANKSEMCTGYATLYGDMNGGFAPLKDIYKTQIFSLALWRNQHCPQGALGSAGDVIPSEIIQKPPSAELRENQTDQDSLPPYPVLDRVLECLVEKEMGVKEIVDLGYSHSVVEQVENLLFLSEYKRRQAPPGVKLTRKSLNRDRRYPITNLFRDTR